MRLSNVTVNAPSVLKHEEDLESVVSIMPEDHDARRKWVTENSNFIKRFARKRNNHFFFRFRFRLMTPVKNVHWGVQWDVPDDSMLLVGIFEYGLGSWEAIKADPTLQLSSKVRFFIGGKWTKLRTNQECAGDNNCNSRGIVSWINCRKVLFWGDRRFCCSSRRGF